jgi:hypothetical protein
LKDKLEQIDELEQNDETSNCLFCKIGSGKISSTFVHEDQNCFAIKDITPQAPHHLLVIPKKHYKNIALVDDKLLMGELFQQAALIAAKGKSRKWLSPSCEHRCRRWSISRPPAYTRSRWPQHALAPRLENKFQDWLGIWLSRSRPLFQ